MFKLIDTDNDGIVGSEELKIGLAKHGSQLGESEVQMLIEAVSLINLQHLFCIFFLHKYYLVRHSIMAYSLRNFDKLSACWRIEISSTFIFCFMTRKSAKCLVPFG